VVHYGRPGYEGVLGQNKEKFIDPFTACHRSPAVLS
jgi:hypothetical protein